MFRIEMPAGDFGRGLASEEFKARFVALCEEHRASDRALVFGAILYSFKDAAVIKTLEDPDYWKALNELAGHYASIFVFYSPLTDPQAPDDYWSKQEASDARVALAEINQWFLKGARLTLPAILFFQVKDGAVIDGTAVALKAERLDESFLEMKSILRTVSSALQSVKMENKANAGPIFGLVRTALSDRALGLNIRAWTKNVFDISRLANVLAQLVS